MDQGRDDLRGTPVDSKLDAVSAAWINGLTGVGLEREAAIERLHALLLRIARVESGRRAGLNHILGAELEDLAQQAAADACISIVANASAPGRAGSPRAARPRQLGQPGDASP